MKYLVFILLSFSTILYGQKADKEYSFTSKKNLAASIKVGN